MDADIVYTYDAESELVKKEHIFLNNFEVTEFIADDNFKYMSVEHYYQCHKFDNYDEKHELRTAYDEIRLHIFDIEMLKVHYFVKKLLESIRRNLKVFGRMKSGKAVIKMR